MDDWTAMGSNVITQSLGGAKRLTAVPPHVRKLQLVHGHQLLVCSDGAYGARFRCSCHSGSTTVRFSVKVINSAPIPWAMYRMTSTVTALSDCSDVSRDQAP